MYFHVESKFINFKQISPFTGIFEYMTNSLMNDKQNIQTRYGTCKQGFLMFLESKPIFWLLYGPSECKRPSEGPYS